MPALAETIEIDSPPAEVFAYATDFSHFADWQGGIVSAHPQSAVPPTLGARAAVTRKVGPRKLDTVEEIIQFDPPRSWAVLGTGGPTGAIAKGTIEPLADGTRSRVTISLDFEARGVGKLLVSLVIRRQARKQLPKNARQLKHQLEQRQSLERP